MQKSQQSAATNALRVCLTYLEDLTNVRMQRVHNVLRTIRPFSYTEIF